MCPGICSMMQSQGWMWEWLTWSPPNHHSSPVWGQMWYGPFSSCWGPPPVSTAFQRCLRVALHSHWPTLSAALGAAPGVPWLWMHHICTSNPWLNPHPLSGCSPSPWTLPLGRSSGKTKVKTALSTMDNRITPQGYLGLSSFKLFTLFSPHFSLLVFHCWGRSMTYKIGFW